MKAMKVTILAKVGLTAKVEMTCNNPNWTACTITLWTFWRTSNQSFSRRRCQRSSPGVKSARKRYPPGSVSKRSSKSKWFRAYARRYLIPKAFCCSQNVVAYQNQKFSIGQGSAKTSWFGQQTWRIIHDRLRRHNSATFSAVLVCTTCCISDALYSIDCWQNQMGCF